MDKFTFKDVEYHPKRLIIISFDQFHDELKT